VNKWMKEMMKMISNGKVTLVFDLTCHLFAQLKPFLIIILISDTPSFFSRIRFDSIL
jgi:hypothetical protein